MANDKETILNIRINYFIISKLWDFENLKKAPENRKTKDDFYKVIGLSRNLYSRIMCQNPGESVNLENRWKAKKKDLQKLGLSKEILIGKEQIELDDISRKEWDDYFKIRYASDCEVNKYERAYSLSVFDKRVKDKFETIRLDRRATKPIERLYYYWHTGETIDDKATDFEIKELLNAFQNISRVHWEDCDKNIRKKAIAEMEKHLKTANIIHEYQNL